MQKQTLSIALVALSTTALCFCQSADESSEGTTDEIRAPRFTKIELPDTNPPPANPYYDGRVDNLGKPFPSSLAVGKDGDDPVFFIGFNTGEIIRYRKVSGTWQKATLAKYDSVRGLSVKPGEDTLYASVWTAPCQFDQNGQIIPANTAAIVTFAGATTAQGQGGQSGAPFVTGFPQCDRAGGWHTVNNHAWKNGELYVGVGAENDMTSFEGEGSPFQRFGGTVVRISPSREVSVWATGLRNPYGIAVCPDGKIMVSENGAQANFHDKGNVEEINDVTGGGHFGFPRNGRSTCMIYSANDGESAVSVPEGCAATTPTHRPRAFLPPHAAPTQMICPENGAVVTGVFGNPVSPPALYAYGVGGSAFAADGTFAGVRKLFSTALPENAGALGLAQGPGGKIYTLGWHYGPFAIYQTDLGAGPSGPSGPTNVDVCKTKYPDKSFQTLYCSTLRTKCATCHSKALESGGLNLAGDLDGNEKAMLAVCNDLKTRSIAKTSGDPDDSLLYRRLKGLDGKPRMPLGAQNEDADAVAFAATWLKCGAYCPDQSAADPFCVGKGGAYCSPDEKSVITCEYSTGRVLCREACDLGCAKQPSGVPDRCRRPNEPN